ncbi:hypothetical protein JCM11491_000586 [Sporobolomyces phaffii]
MARLVSTWELGTAYELATLNLLASAPYSMRLLRVGGANDRGVDLRGTSHQGRFDVVVQCKATQSRLGPAAVREFEAVLHRERSRPLGIVASLAGFSNETLRRSFESDVPLSLVHLSAPRDALRLGQPSPVLTLTSWSRNPAWKRLVVVDNSSTTQF